MKSIIGQCPACCTCPAPTVITATISASLTKCGKDSTPFEPSTPPHEYFLKITNCFSSNKVVTTYTRNPCDYSQDSSCDAYCAGAYFTDPLDGKIYSKKTTTTTTVSKYGTPAFCFCDGASPETILGTTVQIDTQEHVAGEDPCFSLVNTYGGTTDYSCTTQPTVDPETRCAYACSGTRNSDGTWHLHVTYTGPGCEGGGSDTTFDSATPCDVTCATYMTTTVEDVYENEITIPAYPLYENPYTTSDLIDDTIAALPSWPSFTAGSPASAYALSADETSFTVERSKYKLRFPLHRVGNGSCYKLTWVERTTLTDEDPTDVEKTYTWDGDSSGYDPEDPETWPTTGEYTIDEPASNGETIIGYYTDPEDPDTFVEGYILAECRGCAE